MYTFPDNPTARNEVFLKGKRDQLQYEGTTLLNFELSGMDSLDTDQASLRSGSMTPLKLSMSKKSTTSRNSRPRVNSGLMNRTSTPATQGTKSLDWRRYDPFHTSEADPMEESEEPTAVYINFLNLHRRNEDVLCSLYGQDADAVPSS